MCRPRRRLTIAVAVAVSIALVAHAVLRKRPQRTAAERTPYAAELPGPGLPTVDAQVQAAPQDAGRSAMPVPSTGPGVTIAPSSSDAVAPTIARSPIALDSLPAAGTDARLVGVFSNHGGREGAAYLSFHGSDAVRYHAGERLPTGEVIVALHADAIVVRKGDELAAIRMPSQTVAFSSPAEIRDASRPETPPVPAYRPAMLERIAEVARLFPVLNGGEMVALRVSAGNDWQRFRSSGLQRGDLIVAVGARPVSDPAAVAALIGALDGSAQIALTVTRARETQSLTLYSGDGN